MAHRRILILDDDATVGQTIQWIAESLSFDAAFATRPETFFEMLNRMRPDVITIDLAMPELDGVEIMRLLAERNTRAKLIISSGMGSRVLDAARRSASEHGLSIAGVLPKPITREALSALVGHGNIDTALALDSPSLTGGSAVEITRTDLEEALAHRDFVPVYQPSIHCKTRAVSGFEALARWRHPNSGVVMPDRFIPAAERFGLIDTLTAQIFDQGLEWFSASIPKADLKLSLNISAKSLVDINLADTLSQLCLQHGVSPEHVVLELTESSAMTDPILSLDILTRLRVKGFRLSIDDFGTGYSSMVQLVRLPFSEIKIDKSFVMQAQNSAESRSVIKSIIELGHSLGLVVTGEGVENREALEFLEKSGCDLLQGYFIAKPMPGNDARAWTGQSGSTSRA